MSRKGLQAGWIWGAALVIVGLLLFLTFQNAGAGLVWEALRGIRLSWLIPALGANLLILVLWALAWQRIAPADLRPSYPRMFEVVSLTAMAINTIPLHFGFASGAVVLSKHGRIGRGGALSVLATQELAEGFAKVAVLLLAGALAPLPPWMRKGFIAVALGAAFLGILLGVIARLQGWAEETGSGGGWSVGIRRALGRATRKLEVMRRGRGFILVLMLTLGMKASEAGAILCAQRALGVELPLTALPGVLSAVMLASLVPLAPAKLGTYEAGTYFIYLQLGISQGTALALALVQHFMLLTAFLGAGYAVLLKRSLFHFANTGEGVPPRFLRNLGFWIRYLTFSTLVGILALRRWWTNREGSQEVRR